MNRIVAGTFASLISFIHIIVLLLLGGVTLIYFSEGAQKYNGILANLGLPKEGFIVLIIAMWVGYVFIVGFLSTIIAMNENMERLVEAVNELKEKLQG
jgi:hypothetical protein